MPLLRNSSYRDHGNWQTSLLYQKTKPVKEIKKVLRPISLTPSISKVAEDFVVTEHVKPAVLCSLDPSQFGAIPKSSTTFVLLEMLHE